MLYTQAVIALISAFAVLAAAVPTAPGAIQHIQLHNGTNYTISPIDFSNENEAQIDVLKKRKEGSDWERDGEITSCYHHGGWIPRQNHGDEYWDGTGYRGGKYWGYISAVEEFCRRVTYPSEHQGAEYAGLPAGYRISGIVKYQFDNNSTGHRVALKGQRPGYVEFEIRNKQPDGAMHNIDRRKCVTLFMKIGSHPSKCAGKLDDTRGGTWGMWLFNRYGTPVWHNWGAKMKIGVTYHAFPHAGL